MKKYLLDLKVVENTRLAPNFTLLKLRGSEPLPEMKPGQFAEMMTLPTLSYAVLFLLIMWIGT